MRSRPGSIEPNTLLIEIATRNVAYLGPTDAIGEAARIMSEKHVSSLVVADAEVHPQGIITESDVLRAMLSGTPPDTQLQQIMSAPVITVPDSISCLEAYQLCLLKGIRHLVLKDKDDCLLGVVSETDFRRHLNLTALAGRRKVNSLAKHTALTLPPSTPLMQALDLMQTQHKSCVVVTENEKPVGIVTERDVVRFYSHQQAYADILLGTVMAAPALTIPHHATINQAAEKMLDHKVRHLVVVNETGQMAGLLEEHEIAQAMVNGLSEERDGLEENFLHTLVNTLPDLVWLKNVDGVYLACNARFERFFGAKEADILGKIDYDFMSAELADTFRGHDRNAMQAGKPTVNEEWITYADDGHRELLETTKTPMRDRNGKLIGVLGIAHNITARKQTENALRFIAQRGGADNTESFMTALAEYLGKALNVDYVVIDKLSEDADIAETVALYAKGNIAPNMRYALRDTPCNSVMGKEFCYYRQNIQTLFPADTMLVDMGAESYAGIPLWDSTGRAIGLIAIMDSKPLADEASIIHLLKLMATRAAAELERARSDSLLRLREREFRTLAENAPENIVRYDHDCRMVYVNPRMLRTLNVTAGQMLGRKPTEVLSGEDSNAYETTLKRVIQQNSEERFNLAWPDEKGDLSYHSIYFVPERNSDGEVTGALAMGSDITELKHAEQDLRRALALSEGIINAIPDLLFEFDRNGCYLNIWAHNSELLAAQKEMLLGRTVGEMLPPEAAEVVMYAIEEAEAEGYSSGQIIRIELPQGESWFELSTSLKSANGSTDKHFVMLSRDITERMRSEELLRKLSTAVEQSATSVVIADLDARIQYVNPRFTVNTGYSASEVIGENPRILQSGLTPKETYLELWDRLTSGQEWNGELLNKRKNGELYWEDVSIAPIKNPQGDTTHYVAIKTDITERKKMAAALAASEEKLRGLFELSTMGIALTSMQGLYLEFNEAFQNICGYTREELNKLDYWALTPKEYADKEAEQLASLNTRGHYGPYEKEYIRKDGRRIPLRLNGVLIHDSEGQAYIWSIVEDISERKRMEQQLVESELLFRTIFTEAPNAVEIIDVDTLRFVEANPAACKMLGYTYEEYLRLHLWDTQADFDQDALRKAVRRIETQGVSSFENRHRCNNGDILDVEVTVRILDLLGKRLMVGVWRDITANKRAEENLRITASVFDKTQDAVVITNADNIIIDVNPAFSRITGYERDAVIGRNPKLLSSGRQSKDFYAAMWAELKANKAWRGEIWNRRKSGEIYAELLSISAICDNNGNPQRHVGVFSDISYLKEHEAELSRVANYDALTGIPNRRLFADRLRQAIVHAQRNNKMLAVCYIDLDGFKEVNDRLGHEAGDQLLVGITRRLQEVLRAGDTLARLGGDEFVVLFNELSQETECLRVLDRIMPSIATPMLINKQPAVVSASIGVTFYPSDKVDGDTLLRHADQAMYVAKQDGKNRYHLYDAVHDQRVRALHESRRRILQGLENNEFELYYQPKLELATGTVVGVEALIRWHHPEQGLLLPAEFLPFINDSDLEIHLGEWVIDTALAQMYAWSKQGVALEIGVNISARHLQSPDFIAWLKEHLEKYPDLPHNKLQIEVLETSALENVVKSSEMIEECHKLGVNFALDDFGTGYSSLAYLRKLSAETLKIDQSFVQGMLTDEGDLAIVQGIIALAKTFGRKTVAEGMEAVGIEAETLTRILVEIGCMYGQGYGIARPMPAEDFMLWHKKRK